MIDIHSHIIPGIDDGADTLETTLKMLEIAKSDGIKTIIATPHYYKGRFEVKYNELADLITEVREHVDGIEIIPGQEVFIDKYTLGDHQNGAVGTLNGSRYMLVELPFDKLPSDALDILYELRIRGVVPILAHPERYMYVVDKPSIINSFMDEGYLFQINSGSIEGLFGKEVKHTAEILINHNICSFVASDAHTAGRRCPGLKNVYEIIKRLNPDTYRVLTANPELLLKDEEIKTNSEKIKEKKSIFDIFRK